MTFNAFDFHSDIEKGIKVAGFREPSPIQAMSIPIIEQNQDMVGQAHTGTGKTAAFGLPILDKIAKGEIERALILAPTRELTTQISDELYHLGRFAGIKTLAVYGGVGYGRQIALIHKGVPIVVSTPGRLKDLYQKGKIDTFNPEIVVLDEADKMLDMGFLDDIKEIFNYIPQNRQTLLFSATMPDEIKDLASMLLYHPQYISVISDEDETTNNDIEQRYYVINENQRDDAIVNLLESENYDKCLIFCRMKREVDRLGEYLSALGFGVVALHGDVEQMQREQIVRDYRRSKVKIMIATDIVARGIDIKDITHVFNYHIPFDPQSYVHRIGRTGRAGKSGQAITLVTTDEFNELKRIKKEVGANMKFSVIEGNGLLNDAHYQDISQKVRNFALHDNVDTLLEYMRDCNPNELLKRALSIVIEHETHKGETNIGYDYSSVENMLNQFEIEKKETKKPNGRKKRT
ncbi:MAG: DEAD/DEAH box helicase [Sulfurovum sp. PC08-66]|jgi:ATP-dependent RNA helicase DeaD|nr:MAG: DEAD/DEAH box helicase [Sulfurovum sp. PC08-66]